MQRVEEVRPLWVGISTITGPQLAYAIEATRRVHAMGIPTVWGGVRATIMPEEALKEDYIDFVIVNEGEVTAQAFTRELQNGQNWGKVLGLAWKNEQGQAVINPERPFIQKLDDFSPAGIYCRRSNPICCNPARMIAPCRSTSVEAALSAAPSATTRW
ncbi:MAG: cobalamin B12-binding domain-containing protein [Anaerolineales bacterium]|nr:cobalamin B12-binding domain-containing protein [Anaerolineales bacterium]